MRNVAFLIVLAALLSGCGLPVMSPIPGDNPTVYAFVKVLVTTVEPPNRDVYYRTYRDFPQVVREPDVQETLAIVDTVLRRRGYALHKAEWRNAVPLNNRYRHPDSGQGWTECSFMYFQPKQAKSGTLSVCLNRSAWRYGAGEEVREARDEIFGELVKRFGKDRVARRPDSAADK